MKLYQTTKFSVVTLSLRIIQKSGKHLQSHSEDSFTGKRKWAPKEWENSTPKCAPVP